MTCQTNCIAFHAAADSSGAALSPFVAGYANGNARTPGEAGQVLGTGYTRFAGMIGAFPGFHTPADRGQANDFALREKITWPVKR